MGKRGVVLARRESDHGKTMRNEESTRNDNWWLEAIDRSY